MDPSAAPETSHTHDSIPDPNPPPPPPPAKADRPSNKRKKNHRNVIEQRYRQRLNAQFDRLLAVLPPADDAGTPSTHHHHHHRHHRHQYEHETPPRPQAGGSGSRPADHLANRSAFASTEQGAGTTQTGTASAPPHHSDRASGADGGGDGGAGGGSQAANNADGAGGGTTDAGRELLEEGVCEAAAAGRVSKAEVLRRAKAYIRALERENRRLVAERRELEVRWEEKKHRGVGVKGG
ncbi:42f2a01d-da0b-459c-a2fc-0d7cf100396f [Thermothielavioides terrestris]|uniref:42f2a01d-da0b-459c-a2fc-0d7cf100396f n=1 Tax=Thermothielavioides terrestris TaxID=2587410 RepID=A0A3S5CWA7_9PEZI|nr:42f2a01d-da0b-459c-a2fc-0d7cf100396f [Thermothielavioides terrestris]